MRAGSNQVVALFPGALGDFLLALPTLRHLRTRHAAAEFVLAIDRRWRPLAQLSRVAHRVVDVDGVELAKTFGGAPPPDWWARVDALYAWVGRGDATLQRVLRRHAVEAQFLPVVRGEGPRHAAAEYGLGIGWRADWDALVSGVALDAPRWCRPFGSGGLGTLIVHRGAGAAAKRWRDDGFSRVVTWWRDLGGAVVDLRGPADADLVPVPGTVPASPTVAELPRLLAAAACVVGNDSGPAHVAAAVGVPGVVVFSATSSMRWRPLSNVLVPIQVAADRRDGVEPPDVERVIAALASILDGSDP